MIYGFCPLLSIASGCSQFFRIKNNAWMNIFELTAIFIYLVFKFRLISLGCFPGSESTGARMGTVCGSGSTLPQCFLRGSSESRGAGASVVSDLRLQSMNSFGRLNFDCCNLKREIAYPMVLGVCISWFFRGRTCSCTLVYQISFLWLSVSFSTLWGLEGGIWDNSGFGPRVTQLDGQ